MQQYLIDTVEFKVTISDRWHAMALVFESSLHAMGRVFYSILILDLE